MPWIPSRTRRPCAWLLALAALPAAGGCGAGGEEAPAGPNVLVFLVDTLRADALSCYGCPRNTSPNLDAFAREALLFEEALAPSPYTATSHASLFTSTWPAVHGVWNRTLLESGEELHPALAPAATTLAEVFRAGGWATACIADGGWISARRGLDQGFEHFDSDYRGVRDRFDAALEWLRDRPRDRPFFLFLHTYEVHAPYLPPEGYENRFAGDYDGPLRQVLAEARAFVEAGEGREDSLTEVHRKFFRPWFDRMGPEDVDFYRALYEAEVSLVDEEFARVLGYLRLEGLLEDTIVVVTADHGEAFHEHGSFGHRQVWEEQLRIPCIIRVPGGPRGLRVPGPVSLLDLMPSLLSACGLPVPEAAEGRVLDLQTGETAAPFDPFVAEANEPEHLLAWREGRRKALFHLDPAAPSPPRVFDLAADPGETRDRAAEPEAAAWLRELSERLPAWMEAAREHRRRFGLAAEVRGLSDYSAEEIAELEQLGYVEAGDDAGPRQP